MRKILFVLAVVMLHYTTYAQVNIALTALASHTVGGSTTYGPANYNDGIIPTTPAATPWGWTNTSGYIEYEWTTVQSGISKVKFWKADRPMGSCTIKYWDGTAYQTIMNYTTPLTTFVDSVTFTVPVNTTRLRFETVAGSSNPNHREIEVFAGPPCPGPTGLTATNILSTSATLSWNAVTTGSVGYEYIITTTPTVVAPYTTTLTTNTTFNATGLNSGTQYYLHVLNKCTSTNYSPFTTLPFSTLPPCNPPVNFKANNLTPTSATLTWNKWASALSYEYVLDQSRLNPTSSTGITALTDTFDSVSPLLENEWYYIHIRSLCPGNEISGWSLDSFLTPIPCRAPDVKISNVNTNAAIAYWDEVQTAAKYEYVISTNPAPPVLGTEYNFTSLNLSALNDGKDYYVHVRAHCISLGINGISPWGTAAFKTFPVGIGTVSKNDFSIATYPNPVKDVLTVKLNGVSANASITVTDVNGRVVRTATATAGNNVEINMAGLTPGFYMLKYMDDKNFGQIKVAKE